jgi:hypothetical protein
MAHALRFLTIDGYREAVLWTLAGSSRADAFYRATGWRRTRAVRDDGRQVRYAHRLSPGSSEIDPCGGSSSAPSSPRTQVRMRDAVLASRPRRANGARTVFSRVTRTIRWLGEPAARFARACDR